MKLKHQISLISVSIIILFSCSMLFLIFVQVFGSFDKIKHDSKKLYLNEKKQSVSDMLSVALTIIEYEQNSSDLPTEIKQKNAIKKLSSIRFDNGAGYFFAYTLDQKLAYYSFHATKPELQGTGADLSGLDHNPIEKKRIQFRKQLIDNALGRHDYVYYYYDKFDEHKNTIKKSVLKLSSSIYYSPWNWVIVTGIYIDDVEMQMTLVDNVLSYEKKFTMLVATGITILFLLLSFLFFWRIYNSVEIVLKRIKSKIRKLTVGDTSEEQGHLFYDENEITEISELLDNLVTVVNSVIIKDNSSSLANNDIDLSRNCSGVKSVSSALKLINERYTSSGLTNEIALEIENALLSEIEQKKYYLKNDLSLSELAIILNVNTNYLSQVINERIGISFPEFINAYRLQEFTSRIDEVYEKKENILSLAMECGFSSKSSFNLIFKKQMGVTPRSYIIAAKQ